MQGPFQILMACIFVRPFVSKSMEIILYKLLHFRTVFLIKHIGMRRRYSLLASYFLFKKRMGNLHTTIDTMHIPFYLVS